MRNKIALKWYILYIAFKIILAMIKTHGSESRPCKVESARRNIMTRPLHVSILQEGTLWKFRLLLLIHRLRYRSETLYRCFICS